MRSGPSDPHNRPLFGDRIRNKRQDLGLSQRALGDLLGVSRETINYWEVGRVAPHGSHVEDVLNWLLTNTTADLDGDVVYWRARCLAAEATINEIVRPLVSFQRDRREQARWAPPGPERG